MEPLPVEVEAQDFLQGAGELASAVTLLDNWLFYVLVLLLGLCDAATVFCFGVWRPHRWGLSLIHI